MNKTIKILVITVAVAVVWYLLFAFAVWELNPGNWHESSRGFLVAAIVLTSYVLAIILYVEMPPGNGYTRPSTDHTWTSSRSPSLLNVCEKCHPRPPSMK